MYNLRIKNRQDQTLTVAQGLRLLTVLKWAKGGISLDIDGTAIWYFQCSDIRVEKIEPVRNQFTEYDKNSEAYWKNYADKEAWTKQEVAKLTDEQKTKLYELCLYMYPALAVWSHGKVGLRRMCDVLLRYARKCPYDKSIRKLYYKPIHGYTQYELSQRFWNELASMDITLTGVMPEKDVSFLSI